MSKLLAPFTRQYELSKTVRFALEPVGKTGEMLKENQVVEKDKLIEESYQKVKPYLDVLHREFVKDALSEENIKQIDLTAFEDAYVDLYKTEKANQTKGQKDAVAQARKELLKNIADCFERTGNQWKEKYQDNPYTNEKGKVQQIKFSSKGHKILTDEAILHILEVRFPHEQELFRRFYKFFTYFGKFNETRENFYKDDDTSTAIATRIAHNFAVFLQNKYTFDNRYQSIAGELGLTEDEVKIFKPDYYKKCFLQDGINGITEYNRRIGGVDEADRKINQKVNEYRQTHKSEEKIPFLTPLYRQILSDDEARQEVVDLTGNAAEAQRRLLQKYLPEFALLNSKKHEIAKNLMQKFFGDEKEFEMDKVYLSSQSINTIAYKLFDEEGRELFLQGFPKKTKKKGERDKLEDFISFAEIKQVFHKNRDVEQEALFKSDYVDKSFNHYENFCRILWEEFQACYSAADKALQQLQGDALWKGEKISPKREKDEEGFKQVELIKNYCDAALAVYRMMQYFALEKDKKPVIDVAEDAKFYGSFREFYEDYRFNDYYNAFRNFLTRKPYSENKIKLNFECSTLLSGWDKNKEKEKRGVILRKDGLYYLALLDEKHKDIFDKAKNSRAFDATAGDVFEKMEYRLFPDPKRMIPKIAFPSKKGKDYESKLQEFKSRYGLTDEIIQIKEEYEQFQQSKKDDQSRWGEKFNQTKLEKLIAYYQSCLEAQGYKKRFGFSWKKAGEYDSLGSFNNDIYRQSYKLSFISISEAYVMEKVARKELYLFTIINKDFKKKDKQSKKSLHTRYFEMLFDEENLNNPVFKLSGGAEIFLRKASMEAQTEKRAHFPRELIKHKRFTEDKLLLHVPITLNMGSGTPKARQFNNAINEHLTATDDINIIGIDRGEKNLAYYCVIDQLGSIIKDEGEGSFNVISVKNVQGEIIETENSNGEKVKGKDYFDALNQKEKESDEARKSWQSITKIKELKEGYISQVVHELCRFIDTHQAIVIFEDLNSGFKRGRQKIGKQIYQKLEKALIEKLNYLVFKERAPKEQGGVLNAYQLAAPFTTFKDMGKQTGIIFYTNASYTSVTDPVTGFRKNVYPVFKNIDQARKEIQKFDSIFYNTRVERFEFAYNLENWIQDKKELPNKRKWTLCSSVERIRWIPKNAKKHQVAMEGEKILHETSRGIIKHYDMTVCIVRLLKEHGIDYRAGNDLIASIIKISNKEFFSTLIFYINLLLQIRNRNSVSKVYNADTRKLEEEDYILSPVLMANGEHFDSRKGFQGNKWNGDANGAYNIARKGVMILKKMKEYKAKYGNVEKLSWKDLAISLTDWDNAVQDWDEFVKKDNQA